MRRSTIMIAERYGYAAQGGGAFVTLYDLERGTREEDALFLQGDSALDFIETIERLEADEEIAFRGGLTHAIDATIADYFAALDRVLTKEDR